MGDPVVVVGAGLSGLAAAITLHRAGVPVLVVEGGPQAGGRVATDRVDGFLLDRGFQVLLTGYPEAKRLLDYSGLELQPYYAGADIHLGTTTHRIADPRHHLLDGVRSVVRGSLLGLGDVARLTRLLRTNGSSPPRSTGADLEALGFSPSLRSGFLRPFFGGVMLDPALETDCAVFRFTLSMFAAGQTAVPRSGMGAIPAQLAARLPATSIRYGVGVERVAENGREVTLGNGERLPANGVIVATDIGGAARLLGVDADERAAWRGTTTLYYGADRSPIEEPILHLNGDGSGPVNHLAVPSLVASTYAPVGAALIAANLLEVGRPVHVLDAEVRAQLGRWFGAAAVARWRRLAAYPIAHALPVRLATKRPLPGDLRWGPRLYRCGDYLDTPSINGALGSGRRAAEALLAEVA